jgi:protein-arginine kinase activator protein McsA
MKCQRCNQNEATVHTCAIAGDKMESFDLCEACARESGVMDPKAISLGSLIKALGDPSGNSLKSLLIAPEKDEEPPHPAE